MSAAIPGGVGQGALVQEQMAKRFRIISAFFRTFRGCWPTGTGRGIGQVHAVSPLNARTAPHDRKTNSTTDFANRSSRALGWRDWCKLQDERDRFRGRAANKLSPFSRKRLTRRRKSAEIIPCYSAHENYSVQHVARARICSLERR